jgi:acyl-CoA hydrolase
MRSVNADQLKKVLQGLPKNPRVLVSGNFGTPKTLLALFDQIVPEYTLHMLNAQPGIPNRPGVTHETAFVGAGMRGSDRLNYIPSRLSLLPVMLRDHLVPDVVLIHTSSLRFDTVSLGIEVNILPAAIEAARERGGIVIAQSNSNMPYTYGDSQIYENEIDFIFEQDEELNCHTTVSIPESAKEIGRRVANLVPSGSTLQLGIGSVPDAVLELMTERKDLRIWTEMFSDGVFNLEKIGALDAEIPITASFVFGSNELYSWLHLNRRVRMLRTEKTNDPAEISKQAKMTSINAALQVDLFDQANASRVRNTIYSGFGGSTDFIVGALHSRGGKSFMTLPSWHEKTNTSKIIPMITDGVTSFQHSFVVTEQGIAECFGHDESEQAKNLIEKAAHPNARTSLREAATRMGL